MFQGKHDMQEEYQQSKCEEFKGISNELGWRQWVKWDVQDILLFMKKKKN